MKRHVINFGAGYFHNPQFYYGNEEISNPNISSWDLKPKDGLHRVVTDLISQMNAEGRAYSTDFIWVEFYIMKYFVSYSLNIGPENLIINY